MKTSIVSLWNQYPADYVSMYRQLEKGSRAYIRSKKHANKALQAFIRRALIEEEYYETYVR